MSQEAIRDAWEAVLTGRASRSDRSFKRVLELFEEAVRVDAYRQGWADAVESMRTMRVVP